ncbi:hypothetical protein ZIOFF_061827 [Zingiber officinale]|uniref:Uncharacterized protein n=1 Tax=Zingiber officinale TaxID=94328 RepID=A0A8J5EZM0_ZINOF|nr:hypothetical protein ZIOFF_061827 [Zingiber officinale]
MADAYWRYGEALQQAAAAASMVAPSAALKRQRTDYADVPGGSEMLGYYPREDDRGTHRVIRDTESIGASYDRYLRNGVSAYPGGEPVRTVSGGISGHPVDDRRMLAVGGLDSRSVGYGGRPEPPLPPDASNTLFVEGVPANYIFRPFVGFREVRLVNKESRHPDGEPLILCFVDFATPAQAAISLEALQGDNTLFDVFDIWLHLLNFLVLSYCSLLHTAQQSLIDFQNLFLTVLFSLYFVKIGVHQSDNWELNYNLSSS